MSRRLERGRSSVSWVVLLVLLAAGFAWLTRHPEAEILERAQEWPVIGPLAREFRQAYLPESPVVESTSAEDADTDVVILYVPSEEMLATSYVWVQPGTELHGEPDLQSPVLHKVATICNLPVLEQRGDWYRVSSPISRFDRQQGWVWLENYQEPTPEALREPDPVLPLPASPPDPEAVAAALRLMEGGSVKVGCGSYSLITNVVDEELLQLCPRITQQVEEVYRQRYGLELVSPPAEAIFLFRREASYREFRILEGLPFEAKIAHAYPADGYLALYQGDRSTPDILESLVHELTHLVNRRALGPALPAWLDEGIADDLADSRIGADGSIQAGVLGGDRHVRKLRVIRRGGLASAIDLQELLKGDELPTLAKLVDMDQEQFYAKERKTQHYALSSFWVRYLLSGFDSGLQTGFRSFLQGTAEGQPITPERLLVDLGTDWQRLESGFRTWLRLQFLTPTNETPIESE